MITASGHSIYVKNYVSAESVILLWKSWISKMLTFHLLRTTLISALSNSLFDISWIVFSIHNETLKPSVPTDNQIW